MTIDLEVGQVWINSIGTREILAFGEKMVFGRMCEMVTFRATYNDLKPAEVHTHVREFFCERISEGWHLDKAPPWTPKVGDLVEWDAHTPPHWHDEKCPPGRGRVMGVSGERAYVACGALVAKTLAKYLRPATVAEKVGLDESPPKVAPPVHKERAAGGFVLEVVVRADADCWRIFATVVKPRKGSAPERILWNSSCTDARTEKTPGEVLETTLPAIHEAWVAERRQAFERAEILKGDGS